MFHNTKKYGNHVYVRGAVETNWDGSSATTIATLPEGFRPNNTIYWIKACQGARIDRMYVNSFGNICLEWCYVISDGASATGSYWFDIAIDFEL